MTNLLLYQRIAQQLAEDIRRGVYQPGEDEEAEIAASAQQSLDEMIDYYLPFLTDPAKSEKRLQLVPNW